VRLVVDVGRAISQQYVENAMGVGRNGAMQGRATCKLIGSSQMNGTRQ